MAESSVGAGVVVVVVVEVAAAAARPGVDGVVSDIGISVACLFLQWSWSLFQMGTKCIRRQHPSPSSDIVSITLHHQQHLCRHMTSHEDCHHNYTSTAIMSVALKISDGGNKALIPGESVKL